MKILVTGGAGFIGGNFVHHMVNKYPDYQIVNLDLLTYAGNLETLKPVEDKPNYKFVKGDIADEPFKLSGHYYRVIIKFTPVTTGICSPLVFQIKTI